MSGRGGDFTFLLNKSGDNPWGGGGVLGENPRGFRQWYRVIVPGLGSRLWLPLWWPAPNRGEGDFDEFNIFHFYFPEFSPIPLYKAPFSLGVVKNRVFIGKLDWRRIPSRSVRANRGVSLSSYSWTNTTLFVWEHVSFILSIILMCASSFCQLEFLVYQPPSGAPRGRDGMCWWVSRGQEKLSGDIPRVRPGIIGEVFPGAGRKVNWIPYPRDITSVKTQPLDKALTPSYLEKVMNDILTQAPPVSKIHRFRLLLRWWCYWTISQLRSPLTLAAWRKSLRFCSSVSFGRVWLEIRRVDV